MGGAWLRQGDGGREMIKKVQSDFGRLDILCNNVGIQHVAPVVDFPEDKWDAIIAVCLSSAFHTTKVRSPASPSPCFSPSRCALSPTQPLAFPVQDVLSALEALGSRYQG